MANAHFSLIIYGELRDFPSDPLLRFVACEYRVHVSLQQSFQVSGGRLDGLAELEELVGDVRPEEHSVVAADDEVVSQGIEFVDVREQGWDSTLGGRYIT